MDKNWGLFRARANYNYLIRSKGVIGNERTYENLIDQQGERERTRLRIQSQRPVPTPTFRATVGVFTPRQWGPALGRIYPLGNIAVNAISRWEDGGERLHQQGLTPSGNVYLDIVNNTNTDLYLTKRVAIGQRLTIGATMQVLNLFNERHLIPTSAGMESSERQAYEDAIVDPSDVPPGNPDGVTFDRWGEWKTPHLKAVLPFWKDYVLFENKRDVFYGLTMTFN